jgi:integrase
MHTNQTGNVKRLTTLDELASLSWAVLPLAHKTIENYRGAYQRNIGRVLGTSPINEVSSTDLLRLMAPLAPQNYFQTLMSLRAIFKQAQIMGEMETSPAALLKPKRISVSPKKFLTWEEVRDHDFGKHDQQIKFLALHGLRWGEAVVLRESDIREEKVYINKSKSGPTKTSSGNRAVPYFGYFEEFPKSRQGIARALSKFGVTIHSLRKTYAYFLKTNGVHVTTAAKFMGHSNPMITLKIYTQVKDNEIDEVGSLIRERLALT